MRVPQPKTTHFIPRFCLIEKKLDIASELAIFAGELIHPFFYLLAGHNDKGIILRTEVVLTFAAIRLTRQQVESANQCDISLAPMPLLEAFATPEAAAPQQPSPERARNERSNKDGER